MALKVNLFENVVGVGSDSATGERGYLMRVINNTGATSVKGTILSSCPSADKSVCLQANEFDAIGVCAESGIANGAEMLMWKGESLCQVLFKDGESATRGYVLLSADTTGRGRNVAVPSSNPVVAEHFKECGHITESKTAGTDVLVLCHLHFN